MTAAMIKISPEDLTQIEQPVTAPPSDGVTLTPEQQEVVDDIRNWFETRRSLVYRFFGFAGTGKTTIINRFTHGISGVRYAAYTAKAASVMRRKGAHGATTIHSLIYRSGASIAEEKLRRLEEKKRITTDLHELALIEEERSKLLRMKEENAWSLVPELPDVKLIVLDECSMIDDQMAADLESFGIPILVVGDPGQLPPIKGEGSFIKERPDSLLTHVHRQALDSPVLRLATEIRTDEKMPAVGEYGESTVHMLGSFPADRRTEIIKRSDKIIVRTNDSRIQMNYMKRQMLSLPLTEPVVGDFVMCWKNNANLKVMNGVEYEVIEIETRETDNRYNMRLREVGTDVIKSINAIHPYHFQGFFYTEYKGLINPLMRKSEFQALTVEQENDILHALRFNNVQFAFSHAITCHKAQGSQWREVYIIPEFYKGRFDAQWLYTAVTRAEETVHIRAG